MLAFDANPLVDTGKVGDRYIFQPSGCGVPDSTPLCGQLPCSARCWEAGGSKGEGWGFGCDLRPSDEKCKCSQAACAHWHAKCAHAYMYTPQLTCNTCFRCK